MTDPRDPTPPEPAEEIDARPEAHAASDPDREARAASDPDREARAARDAEAERRRRRDRVFGAVLADTTSDERGDRPSEDGSRDAELRRNVPPHHG